MMQRVRARMIQDRKEEVEGVAKMIYKERQSQGSHQQQTDGFADWVEAENRVIRSTFERQTGCTLSLTASMLVGLLSLSLNLHPQLQFSYGKVGASCCCKHHNASSKYVLIQSMRQAMLCCCKGHDVVTVYACMQSKTIQQCQHTDVELVRSVGQMLESACCT